MTDYTISSKLSNKTVYACYRGRFWHWNGSIWKESRIMTHRFELARAADKNLTPQAFLTNGAEFAPLDEYEIDCAMLDALENAKPCKNAPIEPMEEDSSSGVPAFCICSTCTCGGCKEECFGNCHSCGHPVQECNSYQTEGEKHLTPAHSADVDKPEVPGTQTTQDKPLTMIPDEIRPAFDYSGLTDQIVEDLHFAEKEYQHGKKLAERGLIRMGDAIAIAHEALCGTVVANCDNGRFAKKDDTFRAWCVSIGITKDTAYRLLQVAALMDHSSPRQQRVLKELSPSLLYAVAKPSAPAELVAQVKSGDITTHKQYQEALAQIKAEKDRANAAEAERDKLLGAQNRAAWAESHIQDVEAQRDAALADVQGLTEQNAKLKERADSAEAREEKAWEMQSKAEARAKDAENQLVGSRQMAEAAKLRGDKLKAENDALKKQPITAVVDKDEVKRQAEALSRNAVQEARQQAAEAQARLRQYQEDAEGLLAPAQACAQQAQFIADSVRAMYLNWFGSAVAADASLAQMGTPLYAVCGEIMSSLEEENTINPTAAGSEEDAEREALFE
nr:MAG TPA: MAEBL protein [Caudoviricetes sp.]